MAAPQALTMAEREAEAERGARDWAEENEDIVNRETCEDWFGV
eukprot:CAMPEP_0205938110 /NCGR_PEP_ID=MMETSP1325-20131115/46046_1 /ASSEMBLY_ACC=CAM_ASM_000708 /TAXON_ID=236786 /ORGANISM="Florenciella sp., Strain RCC1007" /LENGTH=42 /DNA_ID= /DNA_START= /DNA_END= /DNA_ORIENTATION=